MDIREDSDQIVYGKTLNSELGKQINGRISPDIYAHREDSTKDLFEADFICNISDTGMLLKAYPEIPRDMIPKQSLFIFFMCKRQSLDPQRMVDYLNQKCGDVLPFKLDVDRLIYLGSHSAMGEKQKYDLFVVPNGVYDNKRKAAATRWQVQNAFDKIKDSYADEALRVKYGDKEALQKFLKSNPSTLGKLQDGHNYLLLIALKDQLRPSKRVKVANTIASQVDVFEGRELEEGDIETLGTIRVKFRATGSILDLDTYAIKAD